MTKAFKYRLYPTEPQKKQMNTVFDGVRFLWNKKVETFKSYNKEFLPNPVYKTF